MGALIRKYVVTYNKNLKIEIQAFSKYDAKRKFYAKFPRATIVLIEEGEI